MNDWQTLLQNDDYLGTKKQIKNGGDLSARNEQGESPLMIALRLRCSDELLTLLMESGAGLFDEDNDGVSVFDAAITYNNPMVVDRIISTGIDVNATHRASGFTPLMAAVCYNRSDIVSMLLRSGADASKKDVQGLDSFDYARKTHRKKMLELLENPLKEE